MTRPRWRVLGGLSGSLAALGGLLGAALALPLLAPAGAAADLVLGRASATAPSSGLPTSARDGAGERSLRRFSFLGGARRSCRRPSAARPQLVEVRALLRELRLDHVGGLRDLGVVLGARVGLARALRLLGGALLPRPPLGLSLRSGLRHRQAVPRSAGFLVRRVPAAPVAVLAQLDAVGRVPPRLIRLVIAPFALLASERHCDSNVSAGHWLLMLSVLGFKRGLLRSGLTHPPQKKDPAPRLWRGTRGAAKDSAEVGPGTNGPGAG